MIILARRRGGGLNGAIGILKSGLPASWSGSRGRFHSCSGSKNISWSKAGSNNYTVSESGRHELITSLTGTRNL